MLVKFSLLFSKDLYNRRNPVGLQTVDSSVHIGNNSLPKKEDKWQVQSYVCVSYKDR